jgi:UDPglucose 6-dehydrogenase
MKKIAVIGTGYVGLVSGTCFASIGNQIICCDIDQTKIGKLKQGEIPIYEPGLEDLVRKNVQSGKLSFTTDIAGAIQQSDIIYIAVGTPMSENGEADMRFVYAAAQTIGENLNGYKIIVNKSTVPVGTGRQVQGIIKNHQVDGYVEFDVVSNPEFLREGSAIHDCMNMDRAVIGSTSEKAAKVIAELHEPFNTNIFITQLESAEMIKYAANAFLATKISFINAIANVCEREGADVDEVAAGMGLDSRIGNKFLQAGIGYGGSCFPKDTRALVHMAEQGGYDFHLLKAVIETNRRQRLLVVEKLQEVLGTLEGKKIAVLGLAFKPNTDDMRDAPSLDVIWSLTELGAQVNAFDPIAVEEARRYFPDNISYYTDLLLAVNDCDACVILTEWQAILNMDLDEVSRRLRLPVIIDGRNCFTLQQMRESGFTYHSIGREAVSARVTSTV